MLKRPNIFDCTFDWLVFILFKRIQGELITAARRIFDCRKLWNGYTENRSVPADFREIAQLGD